VGKRKIIIDCDPGHDDAVAILLTLASPDEIDLLGITCVAGNAPLALTSTNALRVCELAGQPQTRVYAGCVRPMIRDLVTAQNVHGQSGLDLPDGTSLPDPIMNMQPEHATKFIIETLLSEPQASVTLCTLGPLTNVAMAMVQEPAIISRIREIVLMGGAAITPGNVTPAAEFNIYVDPEAARLVFRSGVPLTMMGLDVTHQVLVTDDRRERIRRDGGRVSEVVADLMSFYCRFDLDRYGMEGGPLHDPCVIAHLLDDSIFSTRHTNIEVETHSELTLGETVADWWGMTDRAPNCRVGERADHEKFFDLLIERLARFP
jgi:purine nucleosidase